MLLMMIIVLALTLGSGSGPMGMMSHGMPEQHVDHKQEANSVIVMEAAKPSAEK
jgi:hypothetical protein